MTKPRTLLFTAFSLSCVALVLSSCDGDDDTIGTSGGAAGKAAAGGSAGKAGNAGRGGGGGRSGGKAGAAGNAEGGAAATDTGGAGAGAQSGGGGAPSSGGTGNVGAAGQSVGGNGAESGASGSSGAGAGGAANEHLTCHTGCTTSDDCESQDLEGHCDDTLHLCVECTTHDECTPKANGWQTECTDDAGCAADLFFSTCIDIGGSGRCAGPPDAVLGCFFGVAQPYPRFGVVPVEMVDVCVVESGRCTAEHRCIIGCTDAVDFCTSASPGFGDTCNETTGLCNCASDDECTLSASPHCNPVTHLCEECVTNDHCSVAINGQECNAGRCGCSGIADCPDGSFPDGTPLCE